MRLVPPNLLIFYFRTIVKKDQVKKCATSDNTKKLEALFIERKELGRIANRLIRYTIEKTSFKIAQWLKGKNLNQNIIGKINTGDYPNEALYHEIIRKCITSIASTNNICKTNWNYKVMSYWRYTAIINGELLVKASEYVTLFEYVSTFNPNKPKNKKQITESMQIGRTLSSEENRIRWSSYSINRDFDYGLTDT